MRKTIIPYGVQDYLPIECAHKNQIEQAILKLFGDSDYQRVETPILEYMDVFSTGVGAFDQESMFKLSDNKGQLLVLRPDMTMPMARLAATKLKDQEVLRLSYCGDIFHFFESEDSANLKQVTQLGVELMGVNGAKSDAEVVGLAINALKTAGLQNVQIELGQVEFFKGLIEEAGLNEEEGEAIRHRVEQKDTLAIEMVLQKNGISGVLKNKIMELPVLYGGREVLETARGYSDNPRCIKAIENLEAIIAELDAMGLADCISIDLGLVQSVHYYTGMVFKGISDKLGYPILTGGRYDDLVKQYGRDIPATGFAMGVKPLLIALERQGNLGGEE